MEVKRMLEILGQPKTHMQLQEMIKEVDPTGNGTISFHAFMSLVGGAANIKNSALGKIYETSLGKVAAFHEEQIRKAAGPPQKTKEQLEEEKLQKKLKASQAKANMRAKQQQ